VARSVAIVYPRPRVERSARETTQKGVEIYGEWGFTLLSHYRRPCFLTDLYYSHLFPTGVGFVEEGVRHKEGRRRERVCRHRVRRPRAQQHI
jgi:hypothetical protein